MKKCSKCKELKELSCFNKNKTNKDGLTYHCSDCRKRNYNYDRDKSIENNRIYIKNNKKKRNAYMRGYISKRRENDFAYKLNGNLSASIHSHLNFNGTSKNGRHWETLVGYTKEELIDHLEKLFTDGMTWDNQGEWHIDHIKPKSLFNITSPDCQEFKDCWALENLQPLWAEDNIKKSNKYSRDAD